MLMTDAYGVLFRSVLLPVWENAIRRRPTLEHLAELERTQSWSNERLLELQSGALQRLIRHAYAHVPYYRKLFDASGVDPHGIQGVGDLARVPPLTRESVRAASRELRSTASPRATIAKMTSGSTGEPVSFGYDAGSEHWRQAVKLRGYAWAGYRPGDRSLHYWGSLGALYRQAWIHGTKVRIDHLLRREHYIDCTDRSDAQLDRVIEAIKNTRPHVILAYAQAGAALARRVVERNAKSWGTIPMICGAERLPPRDRDWIERAFGPAVFETYGSREFMLIAAECAAHAGLHVSTENLIVEVLVRDGERLRPAKPGEVGEVAVTDLHNFGAPFIRYLNGDLAEQGSAARCRCGRGLPRLASVAGRVTDTLHDAAGRPVSGLFFNVLFSVLADRVKQFQVVQHRAGDIDLKLVPTATFDDSVVAGIQSNCSRYLPGVDVTVRRVPDIPTGPSGKLRVVVVER
jgi:phenylacetate-coenzyme A ligase PaaK-like adenylate-forming protein